MTSLAVRVGVLMNSGGEVCFPVSRSFHLGMGKRHTDDALQAVVKSDFLLHTPFLQHHYISSSPPLHLTGCMQSAPRSTTLVTNPPFGSGPH